jgi:uncharacterized protein (DUF1697 family)
LTSFVALLRGVNVGGNRKVAMSDLRALATSLGLGDARTLLQSGNLVFRSNVRSAAQLETLLENGAASRLGVETDFVVRSSAELDAIVARNPFPKEAERDPAHLAVVFLKTSPSASASKALQAAIRGREVAQVDGRQAYIVYPDGMGTSKLTLPVIDRALGTRGTARNWNTVLKLGALARA